MPEFANTDTNMVRDLPRAPQSNPLRSLYCQGVRSGGADTPQV